MLNGYQKLQKSGQPQTCSVPLSIIVPLGEIIEVPFSG